MEKVQRISKKRISALDKGREIKNKGGRPKGSLAPHNRIAIKTREEFIKGIERELKPILEALLTQAKGGNINAIKELLDRAWGKPNQSMDMNVDIKFSLRNLSAKRKAVDAKVTDVAITETIKNANS